ncbi:MAG: hypothetical protein CSA63_01600 [Propionibacterium sp.]|nr:MAG: hypothetical protein CSA63_01600 [Propionibacterium sp.]
MRADHRHYQVKRRLAGDKPEVNEEWICDKGRFGFRYGRENRLKTPLVRQGGELVPTSWHEAIDAAVAGLVGAKAGVIAGGRHTLETAYAYSRFARTVLGTNNVDYRPRAGSAEEAEYVASRVAGKTLEDSVHFQDLEAAKRVVLVAFEPEDEAPSVFLRLRKGVRKRGLKVTTVAPFESRGSNKLSAEVITTTSGREVAAVRDLELDADTIVMVGERAQAVPGLLSAIAAVCDESDARSVWIPKGSAAIGSIETGLMPGLLPGGRAVSDPEARAEVAAAWRVPELPSEPGLATAEILAAAGKRELDALILSQFDFDQLPASAVEAVENAKFVVAFDYCDSEATQRADVVFPIALLEEQAGTLLNWEHRHGAVNLIIDKNTAPMTELRILAALADALGKDLGVRTPDEAYADWQRLGTKASAALKASRSHVGPNS